MDFLSTMHKHILWYICSIGTTLAFFFIRTLAEMDIKSTPIDTKAFIFHTLVQFVYIFNHFVFKRSPFPLQKLSFHFWFATRLGTNVVLFTTCRRRTPPSEIVLTCTVDYSYIIGSLYKWYATAVQMAISQNIVLKIVYLH